jgi:hypothetical protein
MRCLYCGKELALLKRLTGGGEFCSDTHKQSYQEEYNRLALSRLLQAQKKRQQASNGPAENDAPPAHASVAVEESAPEPETVQEEAAAPEVTASGLDVGLNDVEVDQVELDQVAVHETEASAGAGEPEDEAPVSTEPEPQMAEFVVESLGLAAPGEQTPYQESWLDVSAGPAVSDWQVQPGAAFSLSPADLVSLDLPPRPSAIGNHSASLELSAQSWPGAQTLVQPIVQPQPALSAMAVSGKTANTNRLTVRGSIALQIAPSEVAPAMDASLVQPIRFESNVVIEDPELLELGTTSIDFPGEDSDVLVLVRSHDTGTDLAGAIPEAETVEDRSPRRSLEALSRLHQELKEQEAARSEAVEAAPVEVVAGVPTEVAAQMEVVAPAAEVRGENREAALAIVEVAAEPIHSSEEESTPGQPHEPRYVTALFEIPIRIFPPAKAALAGGEAYPNQTAPLLPELKSLPLRPKVAVASGYERASNATASNPSAPAARGVRTPAQTKPASGGKPAARLAQPKQPTPSAKPVQSGAPKASESRTPAPAKPLAAKADAPKPAAKTPAPQPAPVEESPVAEKVAAPKPAAVPETAKAPAEHPKITEQAKTTEQPKRVTEQTKKEDGPVPNFNIAQPANVSWLSSLKLKLGIAIVLLLIAGIYFLGWGGKSRQPGGSNSAISTDGSGPSIIMGEGGWVEGWSGDPNGLRVGRQITIYRPSLKLSDYRLEFQASIDVRSIGWVFRAADPGNYYAMKLMTVSNGLSPKVALFKYLVANGKQTQVGRVPIDLAVRPDTVFNIRVDVRGPQFTTFLQGQQVDSWTDDQLKVGGAGFLNEREERGKVKSVSIRYLSGASK